MPTAVTTRTTTTAVHNISLKGRAGVIFYITLFAGFIYGLGFATAGWRTAGSTTSFGLWNYCTCSSFSSRDDWHKAVQAMASLGAIGLGVSVILAILYVGVTCVNKRSTILGLCVCLFVSVLFMTIAFLVYGIKVEGSLGWSYGVAVVGGVLTLVAGILTTLQLWDSGVRL